MLMLSSRYLITVLARPLRNEGITMITMLLNHKYLTNSLTGFAITLLLGNALLVALAVGLVSLFSLTATQPMEANQSPPQIDHARVDLPKLTKPGFGATAYAAAAGGVDVQLSDAKGPRGTVVTAVANGLQGGTATFWLDRDGDGVRDTSESDLCSDQVSGDTATCAFAITNPPFNVGKGADCTGSFTGGSLDAGSIGSCNYVNVVDGQNTTLNPANQGDLDRSIFNLTGGVEVSPNEGFPGDTITIQLKDYPAGAITRIIVAGITVCENKAAAPFTSDVCSGPDPAGSFVSLGISNVPASGGHDFTIKIPNGVPSGVQVLFVFDVNNNDESTNLTVSALTCTLRWTPSLRQPEG